MRSTTIREPTYRDGAAAITADPTRLGRLLEFHLMPQSSDVLHLLLLLHLVAFGLPAIALPGPSCYRSACLLSLCHLLTCSLRSACAHGCSCVLPVYGCTSSAAANYYAEATTDEGACKYVGCTDSSRSNYDSIAQVDDGLCLPLYPGCTNPLGLNFNAIYTLEDGTCRVPGCTSPGDSRGISSSPSAV